MLVWKHVITSTLCSAHVMLSLCRCGRGKLQQLAGDLYSFSERLEKNCGKWRNVRAGFEDFLITFFIFLFLFYFCYFPFPLFSYYYFLYLTPYLYFEFQYRYRILSNIYPNFCSFESKPTYSYDVEHTTLLFLFFHCVFNNGLLHSPVNAVLEGKKEYLNFVNRKVQAQNWLRHSSRH